MFDHIGQQHTDYGALGLYDTDIDHLGQQETDFDHLGQQDNAVVRAFGRQDTRVYNVTDFSLQNAMKRGQAPRIHIPNNTPY